MSCVCVCVQAEREERKMEEEEATMDQNRMARTNSKKQGAL